jgi:hypothetical protein
MRREVPLTSTSLEKLLSAGALGVGLMVVGAGFAVACSSSPSPSGDPTTDSGTTKSDAGGDAASADVAVDVGPCEPASVSGFKPLAVAPLVAPACSDTAQISVFVGDCYTDAGTQASCSAWKGLEANFSCAYTCLNTQYGDQTVIPGKTPPDPMAPWGPTIAIPNPGQSNWLNTGSCVAVADTSTEGKACATALTNAFECEYYACVAVPGCSIPNPPESELGQTRLKALQKCFLAAGDGGCSSYAKDVKSACANADAGPAAFCFAAATDSSALTKMLTQECGGGDGGGYTK